MPNLVAQIPRRRGNRNRPEESKWKQQNLSAYRPLLTDQCALPILLITSAFSTVFGIFILINAIEKNEIVIQYTNCTLSNGIKARLLRNITEPCFLNIKIDKNIKAPVLFQYGLRNFYQNARMYIKSRNDLQLIGYINNTSGCDPYTSIVRNGSELAIVPCGSIANSMFNDTFKLYYLFENGTKVVEKIEVPYSAKDIITQKERERKFKNPAFDKQQNQSLCEAFMGTAKPPNWKASICELGKYDKLYAKEPDEFGIGLENIDLIVWMSPAALPAFRKNYRSLETIGIFEDGLPVGKYLLEVHYNYPVLDFGGKKYFIVTQNESTIPKNIVLGILYIIFGFIVFIFIIILIIINRLKRYRKIN